MQQRVERPVGVTILGILAIIGGILGLCGGITGLLGGAVLGSLATSAAATSGASATGQVAVATGVLIGISVVALALGVLDLIFGFGALTLKSWAWPLGVGLMVLSILIGIVEIVVLHSFFGAIIGIIVDAIVLYYLYQPTVRKAFAH